MIQIVVQVQAAYSRRAAKLSKMIYGDSSKETLRWGERRDKHESKIETDSDQVKEDRSDENERNQSTVMKENDDLENIKKERENNDNGNVKAES